MTPSDSSAAYKQQPGDSQAGSTAPRVLIGGTYLHIPTGREVTILDNELSHRRRSPRKSAQTGRFVVRFDDGYELPFIAAPNDLASI